MIKIREIYTGLPEEDILFIEKFTYHGKTADQWMEEVNKANGIDEKGNPNWFKFQALAEDTVALAKTVLACSKPQSK